ncbi:MAG: fumarate hydratase C-terminal domain-containing protein [Ruminococcus sp.]|nr:fumarate hydratase C-terminal domain-containing protein [Candidatus Copronaster equi]
MAEYKLDTAQLKEKAKEFHAGDRVILSGTVYTSRDAAHKRIVQIIKDGGELPFELDGAPIYYAGPTPTPRGLPIGSCGPTTSGRMDPFAPLLLDNGLICMIGKGGRDKSVCEAIERNNAVYLCAVGGAGALAAKCVKECEEIAFFDLGCESVKRIVLNEFPLIVGIDCHGGTMFGG